MILPNKHLSGGESLIGVGALLLMQLAKPMTVSGLWSKVKERPEVGSFERFTLTLDFLFMVGAVGFEDDFLRKLGS